MRHPFMRFVLAAFGVMVVVAILKVVGMANVALLYFLAFAEWPAQPRDDRLRATDPGKPTPPDRPGTRSPSEDIRI